jgi:hypothetical protein
VVEIVRPGRGHANVRIFTFIGHPQTRWEPQDEDRLLLTATQYRQLAAQVDAAFAHHGPPVADPGSGETVVCMDGPGYLTERVHDGVVRSLVGSCPPSMTALHANTIIAAAIQDIFCRQQEPAADRAFWGRRCFEPLLTLAESQAQAERQ